MNAKALWERKRKLFRDRVRRYKTEIKTRQLPEKTRPNDNTEQPADQDK